MTIITHWLIKRPLEKLLNDPLLEGFLSWLMTLISDHRGHIMSRWVMWQRRVRAAWAVLQGRDAYHGLRYIPEEESIPWQCRMAQALGGSDRALIVIKLNQWIEHNKSEGRPSTTHNGYEDWIKTHFGHLKPGAFGGHIRALEKMGVLKTRRIGRATPQGPYDQRKSYRIDHGRLNALLAKVKKAALSADVQESKPQPRKSKTDGAHSNLNNDSNSSNQSSNPNAGTQEKPTKSTGRGGRRAGAGRKPKAKDPVTEVTVAAAAPNSSAAATDLEAPMQAVQTPGPSPISAEPPSHSEANLIVRIADLGLAQDKAADLIETYGADRVRAVVHECELRRKPNANKPVHSPAGWIIRELENDVFKLGTLTADEEWNRPENLWRRLADQSMTNDDLDEIDADMTEIEIPIVTSEQEVCEEQSSLVEEPVFSASPDYQSLWIRAVTELDACCGSDHASVIRIGTRFVTYEAEDMRFVVQTGDDLTLRVLQQEAGTLKAILTRITGQPCRIKHQDRPGQEQWRS